MRLQLLTGARLGEVLTSRKGDFDLQRGVWTKASHQIKQTRTGHLPLGAHAIMLIASIIEKSGSDSIFLFPGNKPGQPLRDIKRFWSAILRQAGITYELPRTTTGILMRLISFPVALVWRLSDACWGIPRRQQPSVMPISPTIHCVPLQIGSAQKLPASRRKPGQTIALLRPECVTVDPSDPRPERACAHGVRRFIEISRGGAAGAAQPRRTSAVHRGCPSRPSQPRRRGSRSGS